MTTATKKTAKTRTRIIAGHEITLAVGRRYLASRPMASRGDRTFDVSIRDITDGCNATPTRVIEALGYDAANALLRAFNNGSISFSGRIWK